MRFTVTKTYKATKALHPLLTVIVSLLALPLMLVVVIVMLVGYLLSRLIYPFSNKAKTAVANNTAAPIITQLLERENLSIQLLEDGNDTAYNRMQDLWCEQVYDEDVYPCRAITQPYIAGLSNVFITSFMKEMANGALLQIIDADKLEKEAVIDTNLVFLDYSNLTLELVDNIGPYFLYIDERKPGLIAGLNHKGGIAISLSH